jgi:single-strand DNA-binding protein
MSGNSITIVGNITRDPELRFTPSGQANARLGVAVNRRWQDRSSGEWNEATSFFDVICWRELAENVSESLKRGARVVVTGRLEQRTWEQEGNKRSVVEIIADEIAPSLRWATAKVEKTERRGGDQGGGGGGSGYGRSAPAAEQQPAPYDDFGDEPF